MRLVKPNQFGPTTLDELFVEKYEWLMRWALHFAQGERTTAEDMVQDTFVRFAISHPEFEHIENAEALLYTYLKHVHLEHLHRTQKYPLQNLSIDEFDSLHAGLRQSPSVPPLDIQNTLRRVLAYLCWRKESTKAASILILRFFYGFFPEEIMQIGLLSRPVVDNGLRAARKDLKRYLTASVSDKVRVLGQGVAPEARSSSTAVPTDRFIVELREILLHWRRGSCLPVEELAAYYTAKSPKPIECALFAHIVSCSRCLDLVTHFRQLPPLAERSFESAFVERHDSRPASGKKDQDKNLRRSLGIVHYRIREVMEHQPKSLLLFVNDRLIATQDASSAVCKQEVEVNIGAPVEMIEIFSEQGFCLLSMEVAGQPPEVSPELYRQVRLDRGRTVEAWLRFTSMGPRIETSYLNLAMLTAENDTEIEALELDGAIAQDQGKNSERDRQPSANTAGNRQPRRRFFGLQRLWARLRSKSQRIALPDMNPTLATALVLAAASVVCFLVWWHQPPRITANAFLVRAEAWDPAAHQSGPSGVVYQRVRIVTSQRTLSREIHRDLKGIRRPKQQTLNPADVALRQGLLRAGVDWNEPLSATSYQDWHDHQRVREDDVTRTGAHLLKLTTTVHSGPILRESLTVREADFHPVARTIEFEDAGTIEIAELDYRVLPWSPQSEDWFESPAPAFLGLHPSPRASILPRLPNLPSETELDEAELGARLALHQMDADTNERIEIDRSAKGVQVKGVVATPERKQEIEAHLHPIPYVFSSIFTFDELAARQSAVNGVTSIQAASLTETPSPLDEYLAHRGMGHADIGDLSRKLSDASVSVSQEGKAVAELMAEFGSNRQLSPGAQAAFVQLLKEHKAKILSSLQSEEQILAQAGMLPPSVSANGSDAQLTSVIERHRALASELLLESSGNSPHPRSAQEIALELDQSLRRLRSIIESLPDPLPVSASSSPSSNQNKK